ncbi:hypothetical protein PHAVU_003G002600 [Phaseolus vulgaris]|uniref:Uncharacterized protein n=1 Tax=Phaseolus vulgaris TaxID=3885 RepID=V7C4D7_PHAVU|nr:hypothetical protein PHAVU_003G002600g [Phaseolus vulgaris]ESW25042.1 hypothetical protein PHAVU_003G002600g [Phaseolus vulgaris]
MECLLGFASSVSRDLVCGALNQLRYPCDFNNFVKKLEEEERDLIVTKDSVQKFVTNAKKQTRKTSEVVDKWLQDAINDVDNVNQLLKEAKAKKFCCFGYCPNWIWQYRVGKKLAYKNVYLEKFIAEGRKYVPFDRIATLPSGTLHILTEKCMNFESRQSTYEKLLEAVKNNDVAMIGLYGMGGCGKTTLAMEVMKLVEAEHCFEKVLFVPISSTVEVRRIQEKIASSLQYTFPETEVMERAQRLCLRLNQEKNILMILDDVWEKLDFGGIGIPSSEHHTVCKILITTRSEEVCTSMDCQRKIYLPILTDEEAWTLFQNKALISKNTPDTLKNLGRLISNECKGLPVAIAAVASSLKGKVETIWNVALNKLRSSKPINIERGLIDPYKCLQLSYDNLDTKEAKSLFLFCSVFPEDSEIPIEVLTRYAIGLGVVGEAHSYEEARSEVVAAKIKLVSSCLLLDEEDEYVKMHDIVRDVAHLIAKKENKIIKCEEEKDVTIEQNSVRYLWCVKFPIDLDCSNLEFLFLKTKLEEFNGIFKRMRMLKVLILVNDKDGITPLSTMCLKTLTNLRYLGISGYELSDFSFVSHMKKLQSLSMNGCSLPSFPELQTDVAITQVTTLKLLQLYKCEMKGKNFEVIKRIPLLEELYIVDIEGEWDSNSEDNIEFFNTFSVPKTLQRYAIVLGSNNFGDYNYNYFHPPPRTLLLNHFDKSNEVIKGLAKKATYLFVANIQRGAKNIIPDIFQIEGGGLDELSKFEICNSEEIECLIDTSNHLSTVVSPFSKLYKLRMVNLKNLRALWHFSQPISGPFENLEKLYFSDCPKLTSLFTYVVARSLVQLKVLKISTCDELKHILGDDDKTKKSQGEFTTRHPVQIFQNLQKVEIHSCRELKHIFSTNIVKGLTQLKMLKIENCDMLDQIIGDIAPSTDQDNKEELDEIIEEGTLSSLTSLKIFCCPKLGSIFTASTAKTLTSLEELFIQNCLSLKLIVTHERVNQNHKENIGEDDHDFHSDISIFQGLKVLHISGCDLLQRIFPISFVGGMMKLNDIRDEEIVDLKDFSSQNKFKDNSSNQDCDEIHIHFSALEKISLYNLPNFVSICATNTLTVTWPSLKKFSCDRFSYPFYNPVSCLTVPTNSREPISDLKRFQSHFFSLQDLSIRNCEVEDIFCLNGHGMVGQQVSLRLEYLLLENLPQMTYIWVASKISINLQHLTILEILGCAKLKEIFPPSVLRSLQKLKILIIKECMELKQIVGCEQGAPNNSFTLPNLRRLEIIGCAKLEVIFPKYVLRCLPELKSVKIRKCKELREIIEEDLEDKKMSNLLSPQPCFPKLKELYVGHCHKLKRFISGSASNDFPNLYLLIINGASKLEELVGCGQEKGDRIEKKKVELPRVKLLIFMHMSNFDQEIELPSLKICVVYESPKLSLTPTTTFGELKETFPYKDKYYRVFKYKLLHEIENIGNESIKEGPSAKGDKTKPLSTGVEDISIGGGVATHIDSGGMDILAQHSKVVKQGDGSNENCKRNSRCVKTQNVNNSFEEGSDLVGKKGEIGVVSIDHNAARNEEPEKEFVAKVSTSEIPRTTTSLTNSQPSERLTPSYLSIPLRETPSNALVDKQRISELCLMNRQKSLGEIVSSSEIPYSEIRSSQTETHTVKESGGHPKIIQDFGANDIMSLFAPVVVGKESEDNIVGKTLVELEKYLKMSLKDIVSSETNSISLLSAINFLSNLPFKDVTLSDGLKDIIEIMQQEFPSIACSFKQGFATNEKLAELEARGNEMATTLGSKISEAKNFYDEAQLKEVVLKEQIIRLKEEIKVSEDALSSLEDEKNKRIAETIGYKMELENVRKDQSQIVEDERKVQQKLFEVTYKWSVLCSQYEYNRMTGRNSS